MRKTTLLCFAALVSFISISFAQPWQEVAVETVPVGSAVVPMTKSVQPVTITPEATMSASEQLGAELSKLFKEGAAKLDPPRPKVKKSEGAISAAGAAGGNIPSGGRSLTVQAYAYCIHGYTASGRPTTPGVVAVDPRVIPMGSKLYIPGYGWGVAADTGGAIVGNKIDVWYPTAGQCYSWGVRPVTIQVFPK